MRRGCFKFIPFLLAAVLAGCGPSANNTPLPQQAYVWQRAWTPEVQAAVREHGPAFSRVVFLARQISWETPQGHVVAVTPNWDQLHAAGVPVGAAIRIGTYGGPFEGASAELLAQTTRAILREAEAHQVPVAEIQLDFDAATSKLAAYRQWVVAVQAAAGNVPVTVTTLPAWLESRAFGPLVQQAGAFVLQVHGIEKPRTVNDAAVLCDAAAARRAIAKAATFKVPFRVALPTYGYAVAFDPQGNFAGMAAEGAPPGWGEGQTVRLAEAQPGELAALVREFNHAHAESLQGILWYRLPVETDRLNWSWKTLAAVMQGREPAAGTLAVVMPATDGGVREIQLVNAGEQDVETGRRITVSWRDGDLVAADALAGFELRRANNQLQFTGEGGFATRLHPGQHRTIGWLRMTQEKDLDAHVE
jgi:hypothetical protein